jgi:hypothetical protein
MGANDADATISAVIRTDRDAIDRRALGGY